MFFARGSKSPVTRENRIGQVVYRTDWLFQPYHFGAKLRLERRPLAMQKTFDEYLISDEPARIDLEQVCRFLAGSYWAAKRPRSVIQHTLGTSLCFGAYRGNEQVAFARVVTDHAVMYWLCDIWVAPDHRGRGLGTALVRAIVEDPRLVDLAGILATQDAHALYEKFGYKRDGQRFMYRFPMPATAPVIASAAP